MVIVRIKPSLVISGGSVGDEAFIDFPDLEMRKHIQEMGSLLDGSGPKIPTCMRYD
jgi:hypothetical protein